MDGELVYEMNDHNQPKIACLTLVLFVLLHLLCYIGLYTLQVFVHRHMILLTLKCQIQVGRFDLWLMKNTVVHHHTLNMGCPLDATL